MRVLVFAVFDAAIEAFLTPMFFETKGAAIRAFSDACNAEEHDFSRHADDYTLFHIGMFDPSKGLLTALGTPDSLGVALQFIEAKGALADLRPVAIQGGDLKGVSL